LTGSFERLAGLRLSVEGYRLERLELAVDSGWTRVTTVIRLQGGGEEGLGEDVTYETPDHDALQRDGGGLAVAGNYDLAGFSRRLDELELFPRPPVHAASRDYRRWAFEAAALDLALRQNGRSFAEVVGRVPRAVRFVVSPRLGRPPSTATLDRVRALHPQMEFKLDASRAWDDELVARLAATGAVRIVDFKGHYVGTVVDQAADVELYRRVIDGLPSAWIEDPHDHAEVIELLAAECDRVAWDAPIHSATDLDARPFPARIVNIKPSRFGTLERLLAAYEHCDAAGIVTYGGGQFELGPGRGQIQLLASLFHPDGPNDVAPAVYNDPGSGTARPGSPLRPVPASSGFRWGEDPG
jgi:L-alanine-DL-glutamate epimerase-like enolase superfamily enzyme